MEDSRQYLDLNWLFEDSYNFSSEYSEQERVDGGETSGDSYSDFLSPLGSSTGGEPTLENIILSSGCSLFDENGTEDEEEDKNRRRRSSSNSNSGSSKSRSSCSDLERNKEDDRAGREIFSGQSITGGRRVHGHINDVITNVISKKIFESQNCVYNIIRLLGYGYYGTVFLSKMMVKDRTSGQSQGESHQLVAIKVINFEQMRTDNCSSSGIQNTIVDIIDQLNDEINILVTMKSHANVVDYIESFYIRPHYLAFVTDYISGYTLRDIYKSYGPFSESLVCFVCEPMLRVLHTLNSCNYRYKRVHKDIKSNNIMIDYNTCQVKLLDFGVSQILDSVLYHTPKISSGTLQWMSPELIQSRDYDHLTDIWSLGITLLELSTGHIPNIYEIFLLPPSKLFSGQAKKEAGQERKTAATLDKYLDLLALEIEQCSTGDSLVVERNNFIISKIKSFSKSYSDFLNRMLSVDSSQRPDSSELLAHPFITKKAKSTASFNNNFQNIEKELYQFNNAFSITEFFKQKIVSRLLPGPLPSSVPNTDHSSTPHTENKKPDQLLHKENKSMEKINFNYIQEINHDDENPNIQFSLSDDDDDQD